MRNIIIRSMFAMQHYIALRSIILVQGECLLNQIKAELKKPDNDTFFIQVVFFLQNSLEITWLPVKNNNILDLNFIGSDLYFNKNSSNCYKSRKLIMSLSFKLGALCWQITTIKHTEKWNAERAKLFLSQIAGIGFDWIVCNHVSLPFSWNFRNWPSFHSRWTHHINCNLIPFLRNT